MKISLKKKNPTESVVKIKIDQPDYIKNVEKRINEIKSKLSLKGFRPGKVPVQLINKMYGKSILIEEINKITSTELTNFIKNEKINLIGEPIAENSDNKIDWKEDKNFEFLFRIGMISEFNLEKLSKKIKLNKYEIKVEKKVIDETTNKLQNQFPSLVNQISVKNNSTVYGDINTSKKDRGNNLKLDLKLLNSKECKKLLNKKKGDIMNLSLHNLCNSNIDLLTHITGEKHKSIDLYPNIVNFKIEKIETQTPSKIDNEFFDKIFGKGKIKTKKDFEIKIKESVKANYERESEVFLNKTIQKKITVIHKILIPEKFLKSWIRKNNDEKSAKDIIEKNFKAYCEELKWSFIVDKIIEKNKIKIENDEIEKLAKHQIRYQLSSSGIQNPENELDKFVKNYLKQNNGDNYYKIFNQIKSGKAINEIKKKISILNKTITFDKFRSLTSKELVE